MLNRVVLIGRMTVNPELRYTPNGIAVCKFTLAVNRSFGDKETDFIPVIVWRKAAESVAEYMRKGSLVAIEGRIQTRSYENNEGRKVNVTEVVSDNVRFLESRKTERNESYADEKPLDIGEDDLPF